MLVGGLRFTSSVVDAVCFSVPLVPVMVSDTAHGIVLVVVAIVRVDDPEPLMVAGLKPALLTPVGNPDSLPTLRLTVPAKPLCGVTVTVYAADPPGMTSRVDGPTMIEKSGLVGVTVI